MPVTSLNEPARWPAADRPLQPRQVTQQVPHPGLASSGPWSPRGTAPPSSAGSTPPAGSPPDTAPAIAVRLPAVRQVDGRSTALMTPSARRSNNRYGAGASSSPP